MTSTRPNPINQELCCFGMDLKRVCGRTDLLETRGEGGEEIAPSQESAPPPAAANAAPVVEERLSTLSATTRVLWEAPSFTSEDSAPGDVFPSALPSASGHSAPVSLGGARSASAPALQCMERQSPRPGVTLPVAGGRQLRLTSSAPSLGSLALGPGEMAGVEAGTVADSSPSQPSAPAGAASPVAAPPETTPRTPPPPAPAPQAPPRAQGEPAQQGSGARRCNH